jgi:hypothetical protein
MWCVTRQMDAIRELGKHYVLCSGVIGGSVPNILAFFDLVTTALARSKLCVDQAVLNWLYYTGRLNPLNVSVITVCPPLLRSHQPAAAFRWC